MSCRNPICKPLHLILSTYYDTGVKPWEVDILRCEIPNNLPEFRVNKENFDGVMKVCKKYTWKQICENEKDQFSLCPGDGKLLGHRAKGSAQIRTPGDES